MNNNILSFKGFNLETAFYENDNFVLVVQLTSEYQHEYPLLLNNLMIGFKTDRKDICVQSEVIQNFEISKEKNKIKIEIKCPLEKYSQISYLTVNEISFKICGFPFISTLSELRNKNINFDNLDPLWVNSSGFLNKLSSGHIFLEINNRNLFFLEFSLFDSKEQILRGVEIKLLSSSKHLVIGKHIRLIEEGKMFDLTAKDNSLVLPELKNGKYLILVELFFIYSKIKTYSLKISRSYLSRKGHSEIELKNSDQEYFYLQNELQVKNAAYTQLKVWNSWKEIFLINKAGSKVFDPAHQLQCEEELSFIISGLKNIPLEYEIQGLKFEPQSIHRLVPDKTLIWNDSKVCSQISMIEREVCNREVTITGFEIKNHREVQIFEQNQFVLWILFQSESDSKNIYIELHWDEQKYCIIGKTKFSLNAAADTRSREIPFVPYESGQLEYPRLHLIEKKEGHPEVRTLINTPVENRCFFVKEGFSRQSQSQSKLITL